MTGVVVTTLSSSLKKQVSALFLPLSSKNSTLASSTKSLAPLKDTTVPVVVLVALVDLHLCRLAEAAVKQVVGGFQRNRRLFVLHQFH